MYNLLLDGAASGTNKWLLPILLLLLVGGFLWSGYSAKKRQKSAQEIVNKLTIGDKVKTIGGVCGVVLEINDEENTFVIETGAEGLKSYIKFDKQAIYQTESTKAPQAEPQVESAKEEVAEVETAKEEEINKEIE